MKKIKARDIVTVTNWGDSYTEYTQWFLNRKYEIPTEWLVRYAYRRNGSPDEHNWKNDTNKYVVLYVDEHESDEQELMMLITPAYGNFDESVYLIGVSGVQKVPETKKMTLKQIEQELGYPIELVEKAE